MLLGFLLLFVGIATTATPYRHLTSEILSVDSRRVYKACALAHPMQRTQLFPAVPAAAAYVNVQKPFLDATNKASVAQETRYRLRADVSSANSLADTERSTPQRTRSTEPEFLLHKGCVASSIRDARGCVKQCEKN